MMRRNRSRFRAILSSPITLALAVILLVLVGRAAIKIHLRAAESALRLEEAKANLVRMESKQTDLDKRIGDLSTEEGIKASIREKYHAVEPGEAVAIIVSNDNQKASAREAEQPVVRELNWWQRMLRAIGL